MNLVEKNLFLSETKRLEGETPFCYLDVKGLLTSGIGNLLDASVFNVQTGQWEAPPHGKPWLPMLPHPFLRLSDNEPATEREKIIEWCWIWGSTTPDQPLDYNPKTNPFRKQRLSEALRGGFFFKKLCKLYLSAEGVNNLVLGKLMEHERALARRFPEWSLWPASARVATHLLAWACGSAFRFPRLEAHLQKKEFAIYVVSPDVKVSPRLVGGAAKECHIDTTGNEGVGLRNVIMSALFEEAQAVEKMDLDRDAIFYPSTVGGSTIPPSPILPPPPPPPPEDTLRGLGTMNPDVIAEAVKAAQDEADKKRGEEEES